MPSRRRVLATVAAGLAGALAGCADPDAVLQMDPVDTDVAVAEAATVASNPRAPPDHSSLLEEVLEQGSAEVGGERPPFEPDRPVRHGGAVYDLSWEVVDEETRTEYSIDARYDPETDPEPDVAFEELPEPDREALEQLRYLLERRRPSGEDALEEPVGMGDDRYYDEAEREASVLVPEPSVETVAMEDVVVTVEVAPVEKTVSVYRYEAEELADSVSGYGTDLREREAFALGELDDAEREVVGTAIDGGYYAPGDHEAAFDRIAERLVEHEAISVEYTAGEWLVEHDGRVLWTTLDAVSRSDLAERMTTGADGESGA